MIDMHVHLLGHNDREASRTNVRAFLAQASRCRLKEIGFTDHDYYWERMNLPLIREVAEEYPDLAVRIGLEVDYRPQEEDRIKGLLARFPFDFVIGSVHDFDGWEFDLPEETPGRYERDADELYSRYFEIVTLAAKSGLFTTIGHFDLIKINGLRPNKNILLLADEALTEVAEGGLVLEVNTSGRYKPVGEFYPERCLLEEMKRRGIAVTLGSDAHSARVVGRDLEEASRLLWQVGVKTVVGFAAFQMINYRLDRF